jgi:3-dehydroquinate synthetase
MCEPIGPDRANGTLFGAEQDGNPEAFI